MNYLKSIKTHDNLLELEKINFIIYFSKIHYVHVEERYLRKITFEMQEIYINIYQYLLSKINH